MIKRTGKLIGFSQLKGDMSNISGDATNIHGDATNIKGDVSEIRGYVSSHLRGDVTGLRGDATHIYGGVFFSNKTKKDNMSTDMKQAFDFAQAAYAELLPGHNLYLDAAAPMVVDAETGVYIAPATHETRTIRGAEQVPGYGVFRVHVWGGGPDQPEDAGEEALSTHRHYTQAVREMLRQSFDVKLDKLSAIDFQDQIVP